VINQPRQTILCCENIGQQGIEDVVQARQDFEVPITARTGYSASP